MAGAPQNFFNAPLNQWPPARFKGYAREAPKESSMLKGVVGLVTVLFVAGSAYAQEASHARLTPNELNFLTDARIAMTKAALQLTPEQQKFWPPIEEAIRARAETRMHRIAQLKSLAEQAGQRDFNPIELMRGRAEALAQRGANMKRVADAWQPLYQTLNPEQKQRMRLLAMHVVRDVRGAIERHRMSEMMSDPEEGDED
jgi:LTXXQ motif family protein